MKKLVLVGIFFTVFFPVAARANGIAVSSVAFGAQNTTSHYMPITFNLTWSNAWRDSVNNDAAWVFILYSTDGGISWSHATLGPVSGGSANGGTGGGTLNPTNFSGGTVNVTSTGSTSIPLDVIVPTEANSGYTGAFVQITSLSNISGSPSSVTGNMTSLATPVPVQLLWNYGGTGGNSVADQTAATAIVQVFAIEMVYVPTGSFYLGDRTTNNVTGQFCAATTTTTAFEITSQAAMTLGGGGAGSLGNNNASGMSPADDWNNTTSQSLPSTFPEGYNAFYMMKYDLTQGQWRDFLNTLSRPEQNGRIYDAPGDDGPNLTSATSLPTNIYVMSNSSSVEFRNGVVITAVPSSTSLPMTFGCQLSGAVNGSTDGEWVGLDYLSWQDGAAYAAWAGLRPFTEFEYEKAARGPSTVDTGTANEYAWNSSSGLVNATAFSGTSSGTSSETETPATANSVTYPGGISGPVRVGSFATSSSTQVQAGASYWGIMELSGNLWKRTVTVGNATGRAFIGSNGTGTLQTDGNANCTNNTDWPGCTAGEVSGVTGSSFRGGIWYFTLLFARVSDRFFAAYAPNLGRTYNGGADINGGARFARTAP